MQANERNFLENALVASDTTVDIITCEYPPKIGGVSEYTSNLSHALSQYGFRIRVWAPGDSTEEIAETERISIFRNFGTFRPRNIWRVTDRWDRFASKKNILLQWAPTGYGLRTINLPFCFWLAWRALKGDRLQIMFHETYFSFSEPGWKLKGAALVQRMMALILVNSAEKIFTSHEYARRQVQSLNLFGRSIECLPVPSNAEPDEDSFSTAEIRKYATNDIRIGHFSLFNPNIQPLLIATLEMLLTLQPTVKVLLIGGCGERYLNEIPAKIRSRVVATGTCSVPDLSKFILSCDLMFQPYPEGISTRRTTAMAALSNGRLLVSNSGPFTDNIWKGSRAVTLLSACDPQIMANELSDILDQAPTSLDVAFEAREFYRKNFSMSHTVQKYRVALNSGTASESHA